MKPPYGVPPEHDGSGIADGRCVVCDVKCSDQLREHPACAISLLEVEGAYRSWVRHWRYVLAYDEMHAEVNAVLEGGGIRAEAVGEQEET